MILFIAGALLGVVVTGVAAVVIIYNALPRWPG